MSKKRKDDPELIHDAQTGELWIGSEYVAPWLAIVCGWLGVVRTYKGCKSSYVRLDAAIEYTKESVHLGSSTAQELLEQLLHIRDSKQLEG